MPFVSAFQRGTSESDEITVPAGSNRVAVAIKGSTNLTTMNASTFAIAGQAFTEAIPLLLANSSGTLVYVRAYYLLEADFPADGLQDMDHNQADGVRGLAFYDDFLQGGSPIRGYAHTDTDSTVDPIVSLFSAGDVEASDFLLGWHDSQQNRDLDLMSSADFGTVIANAGAQISFFNGTAPGSGFLDYDWTGHDTITGAATIGSLALAINPLAAPQNKRRSTIFSYNSASDA